jgi:hypothetical protein
MSLCKELLKISVSGSCEFETNSKPWLLDLCLNQRLGIENCVCAENSNTEKIDMFGSKHHREEF